MKSRSIVVPAAVAADDAAEACDVCGAGAGEGEVVSGCSPVAFNPGATGIAAAGVAPSGALGARLRAVDPTELIEPAGTPELVGVGAPETALGALGIGAAGTGESSNDSGSSARPLVPLADAPPAKVASALGDFVTVEAGVPPSSVDIPEPGAPSQPGAVAAPAGVLEAVFRAKSVSASGVGLNVKSSSESDTGARAARGGGGTNPGGGAATASGSSRSNGKSGSGSSVEGEAGAGTPAKPFGTAGLPVGSSDEVVLWELLRKGAAMSLAEAALPDSKGATVGGWTDGVDLVAPTGLETGAPGTAPSALAIFLVPDVESSAEVPRTGGGNILGAFGAVSLPAAGVSARPGALCEDLPVVAGADVAAAFCAGVEGVVLFEDTRAVTLEAPGAVVL